jgi:hypothetical protein
VLDDNAQHGGLLEVRLFKLITTHKQVAPLAVLRVVRCRPTLGPQPFNPRHLPLVSRPPRRLQHQGLLHRHHLDLSYSQGRKTLRYLSQCIESHKCLLTQMSVSTNITNRILCRLVVIHRCHHHSQQHHSWTRLHLRHHHHIHHHNLQ